MKRNLHFVVVFAALAATCAAGAFAQGIGSQEYVNRRINQMVINRAILRQAAHGRGRSSHGVRHAAHHRTRSAKKSRSRQP